jgi:hypothetical protein
MQNPVFMGVMDNAGYLGNQFRRLPNRYRCMPHDFVKLAAFNELHAEVARAVALAHFMDWNDTGMLETGGGFGFAAEAFHVRSARPLTEANDF